MLKMRVFIWVGLVSLSVLLFLTAKEQATAERGYEAYGGEYLILAAPLFIYIVKKTAGDIVVAIRELISKGV